MTNRLNYFSACPAAFEILMEQEKYLEQQFTQSKVLSVKVWELIKLRISQINQCAFCIDMHSKSAIQLGESHERIIGLSAWHDMPFYSQLEKAALEWAELITSNSRVSDDDYLKIHQVLEPQDLVNLTVAINAINSWNRIAKTFKPAVGSFKPNL